MSNFKPGDVVQLKSGGPVVTITHVHNNEQRTVGVRWFDSESGSFKTDVLEEIAIVIWE
jgi:uncharacterized protein YodC (DUF2158 family)